MPINIDDLFNKVIAPLVVATVAWLLKDVVVGLMKSRQEEARSEWLFQLREVYGPLHFWSAVVLFTKKAGHEKLGVEEFSSALAKAATLLPARQYYVFVKILEQATDQGTTRPPRSEILKARDFVYSKIEALNFVLFRIPAHFSVHNSLDPFASLRSGWRLIMAALIPIGIWLCLFALLGGMYWLISPRPIALLLLGVLTILLVLQEFLRRGSQYQTLKERMRA